MIDVLPTDWSPKNTNLYLASGANDVFPAPTPADGGRRVCADELLLFELIFLGEGRWLCDIMERWAADLAFWFYMKDQRWIDFPSADDYHNKPIDLLYSNVEWYILYTVLHSLYATIHTHTLGVVYYCVVGVVRMLFHSFSVPSIQHSTESQRLLPAAATTNLPPSLHLFWIQMTVIEVIHEWKNDIEYPDLRKHIRHFESTQK